LALQAAVVDRTTRQPFGSGACRFPALCVRRTPGRRHLASFDEKFSTLDFVVVFEQSALGRSRGARTVLVISPPVAGAHEEVRLREPPNGASQVRTIYGKDLEILIVNVSNPACDIGGLAVPGINDRISIRGESGLPSRKLFQPAERKSGKDEALPLRPPLGTGHESFPSSGSSHV
jgi:hypothetical protein